MYTLTTSSESTVKPFNLEAAKKGEPIQTRDGRKAKFIAHVPDDPPGWRVVAKLDGNGTVTCYGESGAFYISGCCDDDLFMATKTREAWVAVRLRTPKKPKVVCAFESEKYCREYCDELGCYPGKLTWEE